MTQEITITRRLAPEDILPGMFIAIAAHTREIFPHWLIGSTPNHVPDVVRISVRGCVDGTPLRVVAVCLPFVMTENAKGAIETLDVRQHTLVTIDEMFALEVFTRPGPRCTCGE